MKLGTIVFFVKKHWNGLTIELTKMMIHVPRQQGSHRQHEDLKSSEEILSTSKNGVQEEGIFDKASLDSQVLLNAKLLVQIILDHERQSNNSQQMLSTLDPPSRPLDHFDILNALRIFGSLKEEVFSLKELQTRNHNNFQNEKTNPIKMELQDEAVATQTSSMRDPFGLDMVATTTPTTPPVVCKTLLVSSATYESDKQTKTIVEPVQSQSLGVGLLEDVVHSEEKSLQIKFNRLTQKHKELLEISDNLEEVCMSLRRLTQELLDQKENPAKTNDENSKGMENLSNFACMQRITTLEQQILESEENNEIMKREIHEIRTKLITSSSPVVKQISQKRETEESTAKSCSLEGISLKSAPCQQRENCKDLLVKGKRDSFIQKLLKVVNQSERKKSSMNQPRKKNMSPPREIIIKQQSDLSVLQT